MLFAPGLPATAVSTSCGSQLVARLHLVRHGAADASASAVAPLVASPESMPYGMTVL